MKIIILHSAHDLDSRALMEEIGVDPLITEEAVLAPNGWTVIGKQSYATMVCPNFSSYPTCVVIEDGGQMRVKSPVKSLAECQEFVDNPPEPPNPVQKVEFTKTDFLDLFTVEEQIALKGLEKTDDAVALFWERYRVADNIRLDDPRTIGAINMLAAAGHITPARAAAILEG